MRLLLKIFVLLLLLVLAGGGVALVLMLEDEPSVQGEELVASDLQNARVFIENSDPRRLQSGELSEFTISDEDLELLLNYLLDHFAGGRSQVDLASGTADLRLSVRQPLTLLGDYLNLRVVLLQQQHELALDSLQAGRIVVPGWLADPLMQRTHAELLKRVPEYSATIAAIDSFTLADERLNIVYEWQPELLDQLSTRGSDLLLGSADRERLLAHWGHLSELLAAPGLGTRVALTEVLAPMFEFARVRAQGERGDPVEENRAALRAMSLYVAEADAAQLLGEALAPPPRRTLILAGREDRAQHFLISAGLAVSSSTMLAQSLGLLKEVDDSQDGGSGFSFIDIGADRTGVRFAELAVSGPDEARLLQDRVAAMDDESLFMADFRDLPELLSEDDFRTGYGGVGEPAYEAVLDDIDARIAEMPLFR
ncbi:MAG TPA: hypothetical protein VGE69_03345 [Pseudomonadales bacterium]